MMPKILVFFILVWLGGFFASGATAGAPVPVVVGTVGMLCTLVTVAAKVTAQDPPAARRTGSVRGSG